MTIWSADALSSIVRRTFLMKGKNKQITFFHYKILVFAVSRNPLVYGAKTS